YQDVVTVTPTNPKLKPVLVTAGHEVELTSTAITAPAPIGKAGARGGVNVAIAASRALAVVRRKGTPCRATPPPSDRIAGRPSRGHRSGAARAAGSGDSRPDRSMAQQG